MGKEQGKFLVFEGGDGSGKSLQVGLLAEALSQMGYKVLSAREPGSGKVSQEIRMLLLARGLHLDPRMELCLFLCARRDNLVNVIIPAIGEGNYDFAICDRGEGSTFAYQSYGGGLPLEEVKRFNDFVTEGIKSNLTILIDLPLEESRKRLTKRGEPLTDIDRRELEFHEKVRQGFLELARTEENWVVIDGTASIEEVHQKVLEVLAERKILP